MENTTHIEPVPNESRYKHHMAHPHKIADKSGNQIDIPKGSALWLMKVGRWYILTYKDVTYVLDKKNGEELACD